MIEDVHGKTSDEQHIYICISSMRVPDCVGPMLQITPCAKTAMSLSLDYMANNRLWLAHPVSCCPAVRDQLYIRAQELGAMSINIEVMT